MNELINDEAVKVLSSFVDEMLISSELTPAEAAHLRTVVDSFLRSHLIMTGEGYPPLAEKLYGFNDKELYSVVSLCGGDTYWYYLFRTDDLKITDAMKEMVLYMKDHIFNGPELGAELTKVHEFKHMFKELITSCVKCTRRSIYNPKPDSEVGLPSLEIMKRFYECERKSRYTTEEEAERCLQGENNVYKCKHCGFFHQGKHPTGLQIPDHIMEGRYRTMWRRMHKV